MNRKCCFLLLSLFAFVLYSCDSDDFNHGDYKTQIKMKTSKTEFEPFEDIRIDLYSDVSIDKSVVFDSVKWDLGGTNFTPKKYEPYIIGRSTVFNHYELGDHMVRVTGYKDGNVYRDSLVYSIVSPQKDFLSVSWNDKEQCLVGRTNGKHHIYIYSYINTINMYGDLRRVYLRAGWENEPQSPYFYDEYITGIYGEATYSDKNTTKEQLNDEFEKRFYQDINNSNRYVYKIWDTPNSHIVLLTTNNTHILAEPRKF